jgi:superfamily II DNA or RNA helicase
MKKLRQWQKKAVSKALDHFKSGGSIFLIEAVTGGGKTTTGIEIANQLFLNNEVDHINVLCPSVEIRDNWANDFNDIGIPVSADSGNFEAPDIKGCVSTYHGGKKVKKNKNTIVILDEIHHAERDAEWGDTVKSITNAAKYVLALTGTPWMTNGSIALLDGYYIDGVIKDLAGRSDGHSYKYAEDLSQTGVNHRGTVPVRFEFFESEAYEIIEGEPQEKVKLEKVTKDNIDDIADKDCTLPLSPHVFIKDNNISNNKMAKLMIEHGVQRLDSMQGKLKKKGKGLVVAKSIKEARFIGDYLVEVLSVKAEVIVSEDEGSAERLREISSGEGKNLPEWIVSVGMVAEGVDIPSIKVVVDLASIMTLLFLIQLIGRSLRRIKRKDWEKLDAEVDNIYLDNDLHDTEAVVLMPAHPRLVYVAREIEKEIEIARQNAKPKTESESGDERGEKEYANDASDKGDDVVRGKTVPADISRMLSALLDDEDAMEIVDSHFKEWIYSLCSKSKEDYARELLHKIIEENSIEYAEFDNFEKQLSYDVRKRLARKDADRLVSLIKFSHPLFKSRNDNASFADARKMVCNRCFGYFISVKKMSLEQVEAFCVCAEEFYREGLSNG